MKTDNIERPHEQNEAQGGKEEKRCFRNKHGRNKEQYTMVTVKKEEHTVENEDVEDTTTKGLAHQSNDSNKTQQKRKLDISIQKPPTIDIGMPWPEGWEQKTIRRQKTICRPKGLTGYEFKAPNGTSFREYRSVAAVKKFLNGKEDEHWKTHDERKTEDPNEEKETRSECKPPDEEGKKSSNEKGDTTTTEGSEEDEEDDEEGELEREKKKPKTEDPRRQFTRRSKRLLETNKEPKEGPSIDMTEEAENGDPEKEGTWMV